MARLKIPPNTKYGNSLRCERVEEEDRRQNHTFQKMTAETRVSLDLVAVSHETSSRNLSIRTVSKEKVYGNGIDKIARYNNVYVE